MNWLLAVPYLGAAVGVLFFAWAVGGLGYTLLNPQRYIYTPSWFSYRMGSGLFLLAVRVACGLAIISWVVSVLGVAGLFRQEIVLPIVLALVVAGACTAWRYAMPLRPLLNQDQIELGSLWYQSSRGEKALGALAVLWLSGLMVNAVIGALVPDFNQDPMWYHLSVPQQWIFDGRFGVYESVMPSAYPLAVEALFGVLLMVNPMDSVLCSLLVAGCGILWLMATAGATAMILSKMNGARGWGMAAPLALWCPMIMVYGMMAPLQPKNDIVVVLLTFCGGALVWVPLLAGRPSPEPGWWLAGGVLLGTACVAKPPVMAISFFALTIAVVAVVLLRLGQKTEPSADPAEQGSTPQRWSTLLWPAATCAVVMLIAMAPWMIRGWLTHGLPLYPLQWASFTVNDEFAPLVNAFNKLHSVADVTEGRWRYLLTGYADRVTRAGVNGEKCIFVYMMLAVGGLLWSRGVWWLFSLVLASLLVMITAMRGGDEIFRLFAPAYALASLLMAWAVAVLVPRLSGAVRLGVGAVLLLSVMASVGWHQYRLAHFVTFNWKFRPVLAEDDVRRYAGHAEKGSTYLDFGEIAQVIDPAERVLLLGSHYPFYLHRSAVWNDEAVRDGGLADRWNAMTSVQQAREELDRFSIDVVLCRRGAQGELPGVLAELESVGELDRVPLPQRLDQWALLRRSK